MLRKSEVFTLPPPFFLVFVDFENEFGAIEKIGGAIELRHKF